jgi:hypothetical protein
MLVSDDAKGNDLSGLIPDVQRFFDQNGDEILRMEEFGAVRASTCGGRQHRPASLRERPGLMLRPAASAPKRSRHLPSVCVQPERPPAFSFIATDVVRVIQSRVPVGKNVVGFPVVAAAAVNNHEVGRSVLE